MHSHRTHGEYQPQFTSTPHHSQPGTLREQLQAVEVYLDNPWEFDDDAARWAASRRTILHHARDFDVNTEGIR